MPGPPPKRTAERVRRGDPTIEVTTIRVDELVQSEIEIPKASPDWHPVARKLYESLFRSAQVMFYEPSDISLAYMTAESLSRALEPQFVYYDEERGKAIYKTVPLKGTELSGYMKIFASLNVTDVDRRRARMEIERTVHLAANDQPVPDELAKRREDRAQEA